jgi:hypothetical protein
VNKNNIIEKLFLSKNFNDCLNKMKPKELVDDLRQDVILKICELPDEKIKHLSDTNTLEFYTVRVILNTINNPNGKFGKNFRTVFQELSDNITSEQLDIKERLHKENLEDKAIGGIDNLYWYNQELVRLYLKHGNYRAVQEVTGIPFPSIYKAIQKSLKEIKCKVTK